MSFPDFTKPPNFTNFYKIVKPGEGLIKEIVTTLGWREQFGIWYYSGFHCSTIRRINQSRYGDRQTKTYIRYTQERAEQKEVFETELFARLEAAGWTERVSRNELIRLQGRLFWNCPKTELWIPHWKED